VTEELVEVLTADGLPAGRVVPKSAVHRGGEWHRSVHVWLIGSDGRLLLQRRALTKDNHPGQWDVSAAGHVSAGETPVDAAIRETAEEIGVSLSAADLRHVATLREQWVLNGGAYVDNEIHEVYVVRRDVDADALVLQREEVAEARWVTTGELRSMTGAVAHPEEYELVIAIAETIAKDDAR
jgi:isopentenyldiphosphate isomerase